jgi:thiamine biosynthesis lipoprotein
MGSSCEVVLALPSIADAKVLAQKAAAEVIRVEKKYSRYTSDSIITRINQSAGLAPSKCDDETWSLFQFASHLHHESDGLFDITSGVLRKAWNFQRVKVPSSSQLDALLPLIGWPKVELQDQSILLPTVGMEVDIGGFGKEYAADRAAQILTQNGVTHGYINLAGDMRFIGPKPTGEPWMIGIQHPRQPNQVIASMPMYQGGLATSGDYEQFFEFHGKRFCHILNPQTGMPVQFWRNVSVVAPLAVLAGCTSTITMLKEANGLAYLDSTGFDYLAVDNEGSVQVRQPH